MSSIVAHALLIESDDGTGNPVNYTNTTLGFQSGYGYLITGRPGLDGGKTITGDTDRDTWYEGILAKDFSSFSPSRNADLIEGGSVSSNSSLSWSIVEKNSFRSTLQSNGIYLNRCRVTYYYVTSTDGSTYNFDKVWTGVIDDLPYSEVANRSNAIDNSKDIFTSTPPSIVDGVNFPNSQKESQGKPIPICLGRVAYSPLVNVNTAGQKTVLTLVGGVSRTIAAATEYDSTALTVSLYTKGVLFAVSDHNLVGRFLVVVVAGTKQARKITSNLATVSDITVVTIEEALDITIAWNAVESAWAVGNDSTEVWFFEVVQASADLIASNMPIKEFVPIDTGIAAFYSYSGDDKEFLDISESGFSTDTANANRTGYPGAKVIAKTIDPDGNLNAYFPIVPESVQLVTLDANNTWDGPGIGVDLPNLVDQDRSTYYMFTGSTFDPGNVFDVNLPTQAVLKNLDDIYILIDFSHRTVSATATVLVAVTAKIMDFYGRLTEEIIPEYQLNAVPVGASVFEDVHTLPGVYYQSDDSPAGFYTHKSSLSLQSLISNLKDLTALATVRLTIGTIDFGGISSDYEFRLKEIGLVGKKAISLSSETVYSTLRGETFGSEWQSPDAPGTGRRTAADAIETIGDALEHLVRNYDYNHPKWQASYAYKVGEKVRSTDDNGFIYICTVAGTSNASEPTFPTTLNDTVSDNTVTWKALDTLKIHCGSFDTLATQRADWFIGRTLTEKKPSIDWYRELARQGWFLIINDYQGRVKVKAWRENTTALTTFDSSNILTGSLSEVKPSSLRKCYNDFLIRYDWNPASNSYNKQVGITHTDEPEFPGETELMAPATVIPGFSITKFNRGGEWYFLITGATHGLSTGDLVTLSGNTDGFDFSPRAASVFSSITFEVLGHFTPFASGASSSGTLTHVTDYRLKWKTFAPGINSYALGKLLWDQARAGYVVTKTVNKLPQELGDCPLFIDPEATDPSGNRLWPDLTGGDDHPAVYYLQNWVEWSPLPKPQLTLETSHAEARVTVASEGVTRYLEEGDPVALNEAKLTGGVTRDAWVHEVTFVPGDDKRPDRVRLGLTLESEDFVPLINIIDENGAAAGDIIDENSAAAGDIIDENGA